MMCCRCWNESKYSRTKWILLHSIVLLFSSFYMHHYAVRALSPWGNSVCPKSEVIMVNIGGYQQTEVYFFQAMMRGHRQRGCSKKNWCAGAQVFCLWSNFNQISGIQTGGLRMLRGVISGKCESKNAILLYNLDLYGFLLQWIFAGLSILACDSCALLQLFCQLEVTQKMSWELRHLCWYFEMVLISSNTN